MSLTETLITAATTATVTIVVTKLWTLATETFTTPESASSTEKTQVKINRGWALDFICFAALLTMFIIVMRDTAPITRWTIVQVVLLFAFTVLSFLSVLWDVKVMNSR